MVTGNGEDKQRHDDGLDSELKEDVDTSCCASSLLPVGLRRRRCELVLCYIERK